MRTDLTSGLLAELTASGAYFGWLAEITIALGAVLRYTSIDHKFTFAGNDWLPLDLTVENIKWDGDIIQTAKLTFADADLAFWKLALLYQFADAPVRLWFMYEGASGEAAPVLNGVCNRPSRNGITLVLDVSNGSDIASSPRQRVQSIIDPIYLLPAGSVIKIGSQRWTLERQKSSA